ncbi:MAG TPA: N-acetylmannosamine-6-phosphate 2-epimerase [Candidatus Scatosoma pullicola]|nr:N-acetylmannosamine-6-phosphate 2-epimerase [Candidatus Scatosoma pullicola]
MKTLLKRGLIVSCQALKNEPLYGGSTIPKMAVAAKMGGAVGIRANTVRDINAIYRYIDGSLPIIGLIKQVYEGTPVYITPTLKEVKALIRSKCDFIALDATARPRHNGEKLADLVAYIRDNSEKAIVADIATYEEAEEAERLGFDYISSTMRSYTAETEGIQIPDIEFLKKLQSGIRKAKIIAEGGIHSYEALSQVLDTGIDHIVIGGAITRPQEITKNYVQVFENNMTFKMNA